jgi:carboxymethylenebutenolidase
LGKHISLTAVDNHTLGGYRAEPQGEPKGGIVVVQEIFGVNHHIRSVCDRFASGGYVAVAPAVFDRMVRDFECGYSPAEIEKARSFLGNLNWDAMMQDVASAMKAVKNVGPTGVVGFCMGGTAAFLAACRLPGLSAAVCYYGGAIVKFADEKPRCPVQMHFGALDAHIPIPDVDTIKKKQPQSEIHVYDNADHGFHCDERGSYHKPSADIAWGRTQTFLEKHMK